MRNSIIINISTASFAKILARILFVFALTILSTTAIAISVDRAELSGTDLRVEGENAVDNATVTVTSTNDTASDSADDRGRYRVRTSGFTAPDCMVTVSDGADSVTTNLSGCTPSGPPPPPPPPPSNEPPTANAGADMTAVDTDGDDIESIALDGSLSSDDNGIASFDWQESGLTIATGSNPTLDFMVGVHTVTLIVTDTDGAIDQDFVVITVEEQPPPLPNQPPMANAGADLTLIDTDDDGIENASLNGSLSDDTDGTITSYEWTEGGLPLATGQNPLVSLSLGAHTITLTVTDNEGATGTDQVLVTVESPPPPTQEITTPDAILESDQADSGSFDTALMGASVASAGDVNGDGFDDVVVGALGWDTATGLFDEGAVFVFLGGPGGIVSANPLTAHAVIEATEASAEFGTSVDGAGDVNGDGFDDIIVGAPLTTSSGLSVSGAAYIFHGGPQGITATTVDDADAVLESKQIEGHMGRAVAGAGDVDGDGFDDVIVGAGLYGKPFNPPIPNQGSGRQGAAFVFLGSPTGIVGTDPDTAHAFLVPWVEGAPTQINSRFGSSISSAGDVNADGFDDIIIGAALWNLARPWPGTGSDDKPQEGAAFIFLGSANGIVGNDPTNAHARIESNVLDAFLGNSVSGAGDVNGDGFADIIVGAVGFPAGDPLLGAENGAFFIFLGSAAGITATNPADAQAMFIGSELAEWLGRNVSGIGDIDGDGFDDVIVGARGFPGSLTGEGVAYVFRGSASGILGTNLADAHLKIRSNRLNGRLGASNDAGNFDTDSLPDLIIGVPGYTGGEALEGAAFIFHANPSGNPPNQPPFANAGSDWNAVDSDGNGTENVALDGSGSFDVDGNITSYEWHNGATLIATGVQANPAFAIGNHTVILTVTDDQGDTGTDSVLIRVVTGAANLPPVANAGPDQTVTDANGDGFETVTLDGSLSDDPDGMIVDYIWREGGSILGLGITLSTSLAVGEHLILLQVNDDNGSGSQDGVTINVLAGAANLSPTANAGADQTVTDSDDDGLETVTLNGSLSDDSDGTIVSYIWSEGGTTLGTGISINPSLAVGPHTIILEVTDDDGATAQDTVVINVDAATPPPPPPPPPPPDTAMGDVAITGTTNTNRGDDISFTVTLTNTGDSPITAVQLSLSASPGNRIKKLSPGGTVSKADIPVGGSTSQTWTARANRQGSATVTATGLSNGVILDTAPLSLTVSK